MDKRVWTSLLVIGLAVLAIGGGTLAWFTAQAFIEPNEFTAGTVKIKTGESWDEEYKVENWNPGDCTDKEITVEVTGSKRAYLRVHISERWVLQDEGSELNGVWYNREVPNVDWKVCREEGGEQVCCDWPNDEWQMLKIGEGDNSKEYFFYNGMLDPDDPEGPKKITVISKVCLNGEETGNNYQGATYTLKMEFEAVQVTHEAVFSEWGVGFVEGSWHEVKSESGVWTCKIDDDTYEWDPAEQKWSK